MYGSAGESYVCTFDGSLCLFYRVILASGLLPALHSLDIREGLTKAILPGMIFDDRFALSGERKRANGVVCRYWASQSVLVGDSRAIGVAGRCWASQSALVGETRVAG
ncbi:hypothetical protein ACLB2K_072477 [Fragaria x ananassa]